MARFAFCWELGKGIGHLVRYRALVGRLVRDGHDVVYLARARQPVADVHAGIGIEIRVLEPEFAPPELRITEPALRSYPALLNNCGFFSSEALTARIVRWQIAFEEIRPDVLVIDHSPTALVANRVSGIPAIHAGNGFTVPPLMEPMPPFRYWLKQDVPEVDALNRRVTSTINTALEKLTADPSVRLTQLADMLRCEQNWLMTFPELDCYGARPGGSYYGTFPSPNFGVSCHWPSGSGPRVFAYLNPSRSVRLLAKVLAAVGARTCLYAPRLSPVEIEYFDPLSTLVLSQPADLGSMRGAPDLAITNGNANTTAAFALQGVAQLALPLSLEQFMEARRLELADLGLIVPAQAPRDLSIRLRTALSDRAIKRGARRFKAKYAALNATTQVELMLSSLKRLIRLG